MTAPTLESLGIDRLPREQRLKLAMDLWDSVAMEPAPTNLSDERRQELERRLADDDAHPELAIPWETAKAEILAELRCSR